jgi:hypothetical protein
MNLGRDLESSAMLRLKGVLFLFLGLGAGGLLMAEEYSWQRLVLLMLAIWAFCRCYYFLFYVLEAYAGRQRKYAGLWDALHWALKGRERNERD